jgi:hypothetical protein
MQTDKAFSRFAIRGNSAVMMDVRPFRNAKIPKFLLPSRWPFIELATRSPSSINFNLFAHLNDLHPYLAVFAFTGWRPQPVRERTG